MDRERPADPLRDAHDTKAAATDEPASNRGTAGFHRLAELLLLDGYDPSGDSWTCLAPALETIELLLKHGADSHGVDFEEVLKTYDRGTIIWSSPRVWIPAATIP